jgi:hypothetical protein
MARKLMGLLILTLVLGLTSFALAQQQGGAGGPGGLLFHPDVKKDLKMSEEQAGKLREALGKVMNKYKGDLEKFEKNPPSQKDGEKTMRAFHEDSDKAIASVLDAKQLKRFRQIEWQLNGVGSLQDPELQKELKVTDEQKKKLEDIFREAGQKFQQLQQRRETSQAKYEAVVKETDDKANGVLTDEQKKRWKEAQGPKFEMSRPAPRPSEKR